MAPRKVQQTSDTSDSEAEGAPETVSLVQSKNHVQQREGQVQRAQLAAREKRQSRNRELDRKLKERAQINRVKRKDLLVEEEPADEGSGEDDSDTGDLGLEARMLRAMRDAEEEMDGSGGEGMDGESSGDEEDSEGDDEEEDPEADSDTFDFPSAQAESSRTSTRQKGKNREEEGEDSSESDKVDSDSQYGSEDEQVEEEDESEGEEPRRKTKLRVGLNHLPDELFTAAFQSASSNTAKRKLDAAAASTAKQASRKRRRKLSPSKEIVVGTRAIRVLADAERPKVPSTLPSRKVKKFLDRTLSLKGGHPKSKQGWERRPVNIGVLRRDGPAANFVRTR